MSENPNPERLPGKSAKKLVLVRKSAGADKHESPLIDGFKPEVYERLVAKAGYPVNRKRRIDIELACKMLKAGWSLNQIGKLWGVSGATVKNRLTEAGRY
jgi:hypothetical protein